MAVFDDLSDRWERTSVRERRLVVLLGLTGVLCAFGYVGFLISDGLSSIAEKNSKVRAALRTLDENRDEFLAQKSHPVDSAAVIGDEAPALATYLEAIANEVGVQIPESQERPPTAKGKFHERAIELKLRGVKLEQLAQFLKLVETRSATVVTQRLFVKPQFSDHEKMDVELTIATFERAKAAREGQKDGQKDGRSKSDAGASPGEPRGG